jgi:tRNA(adenine34) deaminase
MKKNKTMLDNDVLFMQEALKLAKIAVEEDEVPVGAVVVYGDRIIGKISFSYPTLRSRWQ